jgi:CubicO group peptidase (beta-lactamase class C family)
MNLTSNISRNKHLFYIFIISFILIACDKTEKENNYPTNNNFSELTSIESEQVGVSQSELNAISIEANKIENLESLLIVKNGYIIHDEYMSYGPDTLKHVRSVTKSVISALIGIAIDEGFISSINDPISEYLSDFITITNEQKRNLTIQQLLTMSSGLDWNETFGNEYNEWATSENHISYVFDKTIVNDPGTTFNYNSGTAHLLSVILTEATGKTTLEYAKEKIFNPLSFDDYFWYQYGDYYNGGASLMLLPRDMAKLGLLYSNSGRNGENQVIPEKWVAQSKQSNSLIGLGYTWGDISYQSYGFLWWLDLGKSYDVFYALGWGGQIIYCVPNYNIVVVTTSKWRVSDSETTVLANIHLITDYIIPAVR